MKLKEHSLLISTVSTVGIKVFNLTTLESTLEKSVKPCLSWMYWLWLKQWHLFWFYAALSYSQFSVNSGKHYFFSDYPSTVLFHIKSETGVPHLFLSMHGLACGTDNQVSVAVGPWLLVLVNAISAVTHKAFVFHHAVVSAHPLCQPASLSPGIIYPRSTEHMGHSLSPSLSLSLTRGTTPCLSQSSHPVFWAERCNALPPPIGLNVIFWPASSPGCVPFDMAGLPREPV